MYALWMQRNKRKHGETLGPIKAAVQWTIDLAFDLGQIAAAQKSEAAPSVAKLWERPQPGWLKCNTDGAFYDQQWRGATGAVLRDEYGAFIRGSAKWYDHCLDALSAEALACRDGLIMARQYGARKVWLETDCQEVVRLWQAGANQRSSIITILNEIAELSNYFHEFKFSYACRSCNRIAHSLAKQVIADIRTGWWSIAPACMQELLASECNHPPI